MVLKWLNVTDDENGHRTRWVYLSGIRRAESTRVLKSEGDPIDSSDDGKDHMILELEYENGEKEVVFSYHSAFLMSDTGKTIERLM